MATSITRRFPTNNGAKASTAYWIPQKYCRTSFTLIIQEIAQYLYRSRSVKCSPEQIVITCGHQHSVEILANLFRSGQKRRAMEDPGYDGIRAAFLNHDSHMNHIPVEKDGLDISKVEKLSLELLYVTPSH